MKTTDNDAEKAEQLASCVQWQRVGLALEVEAGTCASIAKKKKPPQGSSYDGLSEDRPSKVSETPGEAILDKLLFSTNQRA